MDDKINAFQCREVGDDLCFEGLQKARYDIMGPRPNQILVFERNTVWLYIEIDLKISDAGKNVWDLAESWESS